MNMPVYIAIMVLTSRILYISYHIGNYVSWKVDTDMLSHIYIPLW